jgi:hypothetical protein
MEFEQFVQSLGYDPAAISPEQKLVLDAAWRREQRSPVAEAVETDIAAEYIDRAERAGNHAKAEKLRAIGEQAALENWDDRSLRLALLRNSRADAPNPYNTRSGHSAAALMEAGVCMHLGMSDQAVASHYGDRVADAATAKNFRTIGLHGIMRNILASAGAHVPQGGFSDRDISTVFDISRSMQASGGGPSTYSLPGILGNAANKVLLASYTSTPVTWSRWCGTAVAKDFKEMTSYRMEIDGALQIVAPSGEIKHVSLQEASETNQIDTRGALIGINRRDLINDDLGAFGKIPGILGRAAAIALEKSVYTTLLGNAGNFFHANNGNYNSGGGSALSLTSLNEAASDFSAQLDSNGDPLFLLPKILLVPPILGPTARTLVSAGTIIDGTGSAAQPDGNPWAGMFEVVEAPYLGTAAGLTNASQTGWYLMASPGDFSAVQIAFLNGVQRPTIESADFDFHRLGMSWRVYFDWGTSLFDHRGAVLNAGS